ncbi:glycoside hydrolase family 78 protein [Rhodopirellula bahusiensis]|uniref:glycoside hydrolase family 78 protein n=1 Tax=Rhodopirellula bahusiensis TaxID=2014065 RepID=UPI001E647D19|nr:hypothetical protein [Rhodopirellula bahusiensis]
MKTLLSLLFFAATTVAAASVSALEPQRLRCKYLENPTGIDITQPRLNWQVTSDQRGQSQAAYRLLVASSEKQLGSDIGDLWDSGKVESDQTLFVEYAGSRLPSREECDWKVQVWDCAGNATWSDVASWSIGLLNESDWSADRGKTSLGSLRD